jgi:hypothetical protein
MSRVASAALLGAVLAFLAPAPVAADPPGPPDAGPAAAVAPRARPPDVASDRRCTADASVCIDAATYVADVCRVIEAAAALHGLDPGFLARLIWRESLFDAAAVSPAGAEGIAQFMPETARIRGLADPLNPAEALFASASYLADLARAYGNLGLAAAAYNGGEARADRFVAQAVGLPLETRAYVHAITGHSAETWRDAPPPVAAFPLEDGKAFRAACEDFAATRGRRAFPDGPSLAPWGVVVASNRDREGAERQAARLRNRHAAILGVEAAAFSRGRRPGMPRSLHYVQFGRESRAEADALCARLRADGGDCMVLRN